MSPVKLDNSRVVVIGGAGFIGSHITEALLNEPVKKIVVFDNLTRGGRENIDAVMKDPRVELVQDDITHQDVLDRVLEGADYVFHLAALWLLHCYEYPRSAFEVNIRGTFNVVESCVKNKVKRLIYSSSASVYGDALQIPMTEDHPFNNRTFYGATKVAGEQICRAFNERYKMNYVGLRYMNVYGARQDYKGTYIAVIMKILDRLDQGLPPVVYGDGSQSYDFIYVSDVAQANICALKADATDKFYNVGGGKATSIRELTERILKITGSKQKIQYEPAGLTFVTNRVGSTEAAEKDLGFRASIGLDEGLEKLIAWRNAHKEEVAARRARA